MSTTIHLPQLQALLAQGAQLVDALPAADYAEAHLPGAFNLPLKQMNRQTATARLDPSRPVIVYCNDTQCDVGPRAALRLDGLGFPRVYLYAEGKAGWFAHGLPMLGTRAELPQAKDVARRDVPTCRPRETVGAAHQRAQAAGWTVCIVVAEGRVVQGRLRRDAWNAPPEMRAEDAMENGPTTVRPDELLAPLVARMQKRNVSSILVATADGVLIGSFERTEAEAYLATHQP